MQNKYVGDKHDFNKYLLLNTLCKGLQLGVNWCLVCDKGAKDVDLAGNNDGKFNPTELQKEFCAELYHKLSKIHPRKDKTVELIGKLDILDSATQYYTSPIPYLENARLRETKRKEWFLQSLDVLAKSDIIFYDIDNGIEVKTCKSKSCKKSIKYLFLDEVAETIRRGKSVIIYQHIGRMALEKFIAHKLAVLKEYDCVYTIKAQQVLYFVIPSEVHRALLTQNKEEIKTIALYDLF